MNTPIKYRVEPMQIGIPLAVPRFCRYRECGQEFHPHSIGDSYCCLGHRHKETKIRQKERLEARESRRRK